MSLIIWLTYSLRTRLRDICTATLTDMDVRRSESKERFRVLVNKYCMNNLKFDLYYRGTVCIAVCALCSTGLFVLSCFAEYG
jgi:hypothetical protein